MKKEATKRRREHGPHIFQPIMDWWVAAVAFAFLFVLTLCIPLVFMNIGSVWQVALGVAGLFIAILYIVDAAFFTMYHLTDKDLVIVSQLRYVKLPYRSMVRIEPGGFWGLVSFGRRKRFALSTKGYSITLADQSWKVVTVSPTSPDRFIDELLHNIDAERSARATIERD